MLLHNTDGLVSPLNHGAVLPLVLLHAGVSLGELGLQIFGTGMRRSDLAPWGVGLDHETFDGKLFDRLQIFLRLQRAIEAKKVDR